MNPLKKRAIKKYIVDMPKLLSEDYGKLETYSAGQVTTTLDRYGLSYKYKTYALAMFCTLQEYDSVSTLRKPDFTYETNRSEIADLYFDGNVGFRLPEIQSVGVYLGGDSNGSELVSGSQN